MSSFFRSANDVTASSQDEESTSAGADEAEDEPVSKVNTLSSTASGLKLTETLQPLGVVNSARDVTLIDGSGRQHSDNILHALLYERCASEALTHYLEQSGRPHTKDHPDVKDLAQRKYEYMSDQLRKHGLIPTGTQGESSPKLRNAYSSGLDLLSSTSPLPGRPGLASRPSAANELDVAIRKLSISSPSSRPKPPFQQFRLTQRTNNPHQMLNLPPLLQPLVEHQMFEISRYRREFNEIGCIGKGGYGKVYHVKHKLDGADYAIKKITLSSARVRRIEERGQDELDRLLMEVRTLARFDHPNIVRYYGGWLEYTMPAASGPAASVRHSLQLLEVEATNSDDDDSANSGTKDVSNSSFGPSVRAQGDSDVDVVFDGSEDEIYSEEVTGSGAPPLGKTGGLVSSPSQPPRRNSESTTASAGSRITTAQSISGEIAQPLHAVPEADQLESESIDPSLSSFGHANQVRLTSEPQLTLHIQMSLHPLSLADFLSPQSESLSNQGFEFRHCFHPQISMRILLAILDGVQYLHSTRLIHRDLKPSNIFLSFHSSPSLSCIDLSSCQTCTHPRTPTPYLTIRIGDFGLVTEIAQPDGGASSVLASKAVGTELYRPHDSSGKLDESLDVYALGIIAVELLQRFETKMERLGRLGDARSGKFDGVVAERTVEGGDELLECIRRMICEEKERFSCREVRERIEKFLSP